MVRPSTLRVNRRSRRILSTSARALIDACHRPARDTHVDASRPGGELAKHGLRYGDLERDVGRSSEYELKARAEMEDEEPVREGGGDDVRAQERPCGGER